MAAIAVFCGSASGLRAEFADAAACFARLASARGHALVTGGGRVGLMGVVADAALAAGGEVIGVIPDFLMTGERAHRGLTRLEIVGSMHARKARFAELADAFVALPGGLGTLEEICEATTWAALALHAKPCALLNTAGHYSPLIQFLDQAVGRGLMRRDHRRLLVAEADPQQLLDRIEPAFAELALPAPPPQELF